MAEIVLRTSTQGIALGYYVLAFQARNWLMQTFYERIWHLPAKMLRHRFAGCSAEKLSYRVTGDS